MKTSTPATVTKGKGFTAYSYPTSKIGPYRAVQYDYTAIIYNDAVDPCKAVWEASSMDEAEAWMQERAAS